MYIKKHTHHLNLNSTLTNQKKKSKLNSRQPQGSKNIHIQVEINEIKIKKITEKSMKPNIGSLKRSTLLTNLQKTDQKQSDY